MTAAAPWGRLLTLPIWRWCQCGRPTAPWNWGTGDECAPCHPEGKNQYSAWRFEVSPDELRHPPKPLGLKTGLFRQVRQAVPIEDLANRFTTLRPAGPGKLKGLCPLHHEKTASFYIYQTLDRWHCFGACARGGDVVDLARMLVDQGKL